MRKCKNYQQNIENLPDLVAEECKKVKGTFTNPQNHFWKSGKTLSTTCKYCKNLNRRKKAVYEPTITVNWPVDEDGNWLNYWHFLED